MLERYLDDLTSYAESVVSEEVELKESFPGEQILQVSLPGMVSTRSSTEEISTYDCFYGPFGDLTFAEPIYSAKTGRRKKFPLMRKLFGLND